MYFGAIISATDPVTVLAVFQQKSVDVDLDAILFGESILNDAVAIVLAGAIKSAAPVVEIGDGPDSYLTSKITNVVDPTAINKTDIYHDVIAQQVSPNNSNDVNVLQIILNFFGVFIGSFLIGAVIAIFNSIFFKLVPFVSEPIMETAIFVMASWSAFLTAEWLGCSGIVAVLFAGILQAQYTYRNLSKLGQTLTKEFFHLLAFVNENFVFCYMGLTITQASKQNWNLWFIIGSFIGIIAGRAANIYPLSFLLNLANSSKHNPEKPVLIPPKFQHMMMWSGLRGAMAFALAIRNTITTKDQTIFTTTLLICYLTVWILGSGSSFMLDKLQIKVGVNPDEDLVGPTGTYYSKNFIFKIWHKIDKQILRPILTTNLYGEDCSPVLNNNDSSNSLGNEMQDRHLYGEVVNNNISHQRGVPTKDMRRQSSNFSSVDGHGFTVVPDNTGDSGGRTATGNHLRSLDQSQNDDAILHDSNNSIAEINVNMNHNPFQ